MVPGALVRELIGIAVLAIVVGCSSSGYEPPTVAQMQKAKEIRESRGIFNFASIDYVSERISFTYGSPKLNEMDFREYEEFIHRVVENQTVVTDSSVHGTQLEYFSPAGDVSLWYPGNTQAVSGRFRTKIDTQPFNIWGDRTAVLICFTYEVGTRNAVTGTEGGDEACTNAYSYIASIVGKRTGDPFDLTSGRVPFVLNKTERWSGGLPKSGGRKGSAERTVWPDGASWFEVPVPHYAEPVTSHD
jgi:hypothetical protein